MWYSNQEKARFYDWWVEFDRNYAKFSRRVRKENGIHAHVPDHKTMHKWQKRFHEEASLQRKKKASNRYVRTEEKIEQTRQMFSTVHKLSIRRASQGLGVSVGTVFNILKQIKFHPYKLQLVQKLQQTDYQTSVDFAQDMLQRLEADPNLLGNLFFADEAHFHLHGGVNRHNFRYWSDTNPHWYTEEPLHSPKVTVWLGIGLSGIVGPFFWERDDTFPLEKGINSRWYKQMLEKYVIPAMQQLDNFDNLVFMHDGAPPHRGLQVRNLLDQTFPDRWIGYGSDTNPAPIN